MSALTTLLGYLVTLALILGLLGLWAAVWGVLWAVINTLWWLGWLERGK